MDYMCQCRDKKCEHGAKHCGLRAFCEVEINGRKVAMCLPCGGVAFAKKSESENNGEEN